MISRRSDDESARRALRQAAGELYARLLAPAERLIARAERVVIVPDGALHVLPFAALASDRGRRRGEPIVAWKPLHTVVSMTVYAELEGRQQRRHGVMPVRTAAVGAACAAGCANPGVRGSTGVRGRRRAPAAMRAARERCRMDAPGWTRDGGTENGHADRSRRPGSGVSERGCGVRRG